MLDLRKATFGALEISFLVNVRYLLHYYFRCFLLLQKLQIKARIKYKNSMKQYPFYFFYFLVYCAV